MLSVTYFYREPRKTGLSIEGIFRLVKECLEGKVEIQEFYCDLGLSRLQNTIRARKFSGEINHITGDVNFLAFALRGKKNILTIHDIGHYDTLKERGVIQHSIYKLFWYKYPLKYIDIVTVVSEFTKRKLIEYFNFPEERIRVIHNPIKPVFKFTKKETLNTHPRVLMLGSGKHKNLDNLIEAANGTGFHLDIVGWPAQDELNKLDKYNISYKVYNGLSDIEVYQRYVDCDILYIASFYEGFGMPIIEAQAVGRPVITSNIGAMKEIGEGCAILVDPHNPIEIRDAIRSLQNKELYDHLVEHGLASASEYDYQKITQQYLDVYLELAAKISN